MLTPEESADLLDSTMDVLESEVTTAIPQSGLDIIDQWLVQLRQTENAKEITNTLEQVKTQLESNQINTQELIQLFDTLATQTIEFSTHVGSEGDMAVRLEAISSALQSLAGQLGR
ncbi:hypothetical protein GO755_23395 [Spirosoma sp. HMF4905]|uniref:Uncharacterized protein n=1 Tax=Spirosoma arboris TaxID=2682092 RepID=A0A7K1SHD1_9BACT|nr:hypothetical protein [Spirosoma arboris]MVM33006.1 hypothetical protein [Spirosoma arboris]